MKTLPRFIKSNFFMYGPYDDSKEIIISDKAKRATNKMMTNFYQICDKDEVFILDVEEGYMNELQENFISNEFYLEHEELFDIVEGFDIMPVVD